MFLKSHNSLLIYISAVLSAVVILSGQQVHSQDQSNDLPLGDAPNQDEIGHQQAHDDLGFVPFPMRVPSDMRIGIAPEETDFEDLNQDTSVETSQHNHNNQQQPLDSNTESGNRKDRNFYRGTILYIEAKSILNALPDVPNPDNIGRYYRPRRNLWSMFSDGAFQSICNTLLFPVPELYRLEICGISPRVAGDSSKLPKASSFSKQSRAQLSEKRQKQLEILDNKKLELKRAFALLEESSNLGNKDSIFTRAEFYFYGNYTHPQDFYESYKLYHKLAECSGNATAQFMLGVMYSTGMFGTTPQDQARANLYYTFAAENGDYRAKMAMGFRHQQGIGTPRNYKTAARYFKETAKIAYHYFLTGPPGGRHLTQYDWLLSDKDGGILGEGASRVPPYRHYPLLPQSSTQSFDMALNYLSYLSLLDDTSVAANYALASLYFTGDIVVDPDYEKSITHVRKCLEETANPLYKETKTLHSMCAGFLGLRYMRGEGVPQNYAEALKWLEVGASYGDETCKSALGFMYLEGLGVLQNEKNATELFKASEKSGLSNFHMGRILLRNGDVNSAYLHFDAASKKNIIGGFYHQGMQLNQGKWGKEADSAPYFQLVSEKVHSFHSPLRWAHVQYHQGDFGSALLGFMIAAEEGYQEAQSNIAYMLDDQRSVINIENILSKYLGIKPSLLLTAHAKGLVSSPNKQETPAQKDIDQKEHTDFGNFVYRDPAGYANWKQQKDFLSFFYWNRLANSYKIDAIVKVGDYFLSGIGVKPNPAEAAARYQLAADYNSPISRWNLGWMYENGIGVEQDFHLAKRYYDTAAVTVREAYFPVTLSLLKLRVRSSLSSFWKKSGSKNPSLSEAETPEERNTYIEGENLVKSSDRPKSFREGLKLIFTKWNKGQDQDRQKRRKSFAEASGIDLSEDELDEIEAYMYLLITYLVIAITIFLVYQRWRANARADQEGPLPNPRNPGNQGQNN